MTIAIIGGTGPQGKGLALRFAKAGENVVIGSRDGARAAEAAQELQTDITRRQRRKLPAWTILQPPEKPPGWLFWQCHSVPITPRWKV